MFWTHTKDALRAGLAAPGIRHALRWFINCSAFAPEWRKLAHRKIAKRARFQAGSVFRHVTSAGVTFSLLHGGTSSYLYWLGEYEPETTRLFTTLARTARCILDIGTADGIYSLLAAAANPEARILAFEPGEEACRTCERNLELNPRITGRVELRQIALGDRDETTTLYVAGETGGTSSLNPEFRRAVREQPVSVRAGDSLLAELRIDRVDLLKIDTESTEPAVLRGLANQLGAHHPDIICEVLHDRTERELETLLRPLGYRFFWITKSRLVECDALAGDPSYRSPNYLFTCRDDDALRAVGVKL